MPLPFEGIIARLVPGKKPKVRESHTAMLLDLERNEAKVRRRDEFGRYCPVSHVRPKTASEFKCST